MGAGQGLGVVRDCRGNVVWFGIVRPELMDTMLAAHVIGHPRVGDRPLLLGDAVTFVLPRNWRHRDLALEELEGLAFIRPPPASPSPTSPAAPERPTPAPGVTQR